MYLDVKMKRHRCLGQPGACRFRNEMDALPDRLARFECGDIRAILYAQEAKSRESCGGSRVLSRDFPHAFFIAPDKPVVEIGEDIVLQDCGHIVVI